MVHIIAFRGCGLMFWILACCVEFLGFRTAPMLQQLFFYFFINLFILFSFCFFVLFFVFSVWKFTRKQTNYHGLGMQRAGKFPGILETFHGKFREFWRGGNFRKFSILTYFQHFMRLFAQKSIELNLLGTIFEHTCSALLFSQFIDLYGSTEKTIRLYYEITLDLICLIFIKLISLCFSTLF